MSTEQVPSCWVYLAVSKFLKSDPEMSAFSRWSILAALYRDGFMQAKIGDVDACVVFISEGGRLRDTEFDDHPGLISTPKVST